MRLPRVRFRLWHLLLAVAWEGLLAAYVVWFLRGLRIHGRTFVVPDADVLLTFVIASIASLVSACCVAFVIWLVKKGPNLSSHD
jgi:hypothetical protein